jgi:hypothetical protein
MRTAGEQHFSVVGSECPICNEGNPRQSFLKSGELGQPGGTGRDHHGIHQPTLEQPAQCGRSPTDDDPGTAPGKRAPEREESATTLEGGGDRGHCQPFAGRSDPRGERPAPTATRVRTISPARLSTPRALS